MKMASFIRSGASGSASGKSITTSRGSSAVARLAEGSSVAMASPEGGGSSPSSLPMLKCSGWDPAAWDGGAAAVGVSSGVALGGATGGIARPPGEPGTALTIGVSVPVLAMGGVTGLLSAMIGVVGAGVGCAGTGTGLGAAAGAAAGARGAVGEYCGLVGDGLAGEDLGATGAERRRAGRPPLGRAVPAFATAAAAAMADGGPAAVAGALATFAIAVATSADVYPVAWRPVSHDDHGEASVVPVLPAAARLAGCAGSTSAVVDSVMGWSA